MGTTRRTRVRRAFVALVLLLGSSAAAAPAMSTVSSRGESSLAARGAGGLADNVVFDAGVNRFRSTATGRFVSNQSALEGATVSRVFGGEARAFGQSFTVGDLGQFSNVRKSLGLFEGNTGRFFLEGRITDFSGVRVRGALPGPLGPANAVEVLIPNAERQIQLLRVGGVNPPF